MEHENSKPSSIYFIFCFFLLDRQGGGGGRGHFPLGPSIATTLAIAKEQRFALGTIQLIEADKSYTTTC